MPDMSGRKIIICNPSSPSYSRDRGREVNDRKCANCGQRWGTHFSSLCPSFEVDEMDFYIPFPNKAGMKWSDIPPTTKKGNRVIIC